jgi:hypothetical protein
VCQIAQGGDGGVKELGVLEEVKCILKRDVENNQRSIKDGKLQLH